MILLTKKQHHRIKIHYFRIKACIFLSLRFLAFSVRCLGYLEIQLRGTAVDQVGLSGMNINWLAAISTPHLHSNYLRFGRTIKCSVCRPTRCKNILTNFSFLLVLFPLEIF